MPNGPGEDHVLAESKARSQTTRASLLRTTASDYEPNILACPGDTRGDTQKRWQILLPN